MKREQIRGRLIRFSLVVTLVVALAASACSQPEASDFTGTWVSRLNPSDYIVFSADGTCHRQLDGLKEDGKWLLGAEVGWKGNILVADFRSESLEDSFFIKGSKLVDMYDVVWTKQ
jgi:hypothetical protein